MYLFFFYVPAGQCEKVKNAVFDAGAGRYRSYSRCSWQTNGTGQFKPEEGSTPYIGEIGRVEHAAEIKVEMIVEDSLVDGVMIALRDTHPYEEPAFGFIRLADMEKSDG